MTSPLHAERNRKVKSADGQRRSLTVADSVLSLRHQTISGLMWSFLEDLGRTGLIFACGIVLARLLTPREFGLIGMTTVLIVFSRVFVDSGFSQALIRKQDCTPADFSTVFFFNLAVGTFFYGLLIITANPISRFFNEPQLSGVIRFIGAGLVLNALGQVHRIQITKDLDFKLLTRISVLSSAIGGIIGILMAYEGYGVWSLVAMTLSRSTIELVLLWVWRRWRPALIFDRAAFKELFAFGSPLLVGSIISSIYRHLSSVVIGRFFSAADLGQFTQAQNFRNLPSERLTDVIQRVSYPALSTLQNDMPRLKTAYRRLIRSFMLVTSLVMLGLAAVAEPVMMTLVGEQWRPAVGYLRLLCFVAMLYPLHAVNLNMLLVRGRSDLRLKLSIIKTCMSVPALVIGVFYGISAMIIAMFFVSLIGYFFTASWSGKLIGYSLGTQIRDILPSIALGLAMAIAVNALGQWIPFAYFPKLIIQVAAGVLLAFVLAELTRLESYLYLRSIAAEKLKGMMHDCAVHSRRKG